MKNKTTLLMIGTLLWFNSFAGDQKLKSKPKKSEEIGLIVYGKINTGVKVRKIEFNLYELNDLVVSGRVNRKGEFEVPLYLGQEYILEIAADGFLPKRFYFDTRVPGQIDKLFVFGFSVDLLQEECVSGADIFSLDFPYALVKYDEKSFEFNFIKEYTDQIKKEESDAMKQAAQQPL